jgi:hypothetical protein
MAGVKPWPIYSMLESHLLSARKLGWKTQAVSSWKGKDKFLFNQFILCD